MPNCLTAESTGTHIKYPDGRESTVSLRDIAPCPASDPSSSTEGFPGISDDINVDSQSQSMMETNNNCDNISLFDGNDHHETQNEFPTDNASADNVIDESLLRRSCRTRREPDRYGNIL